MTPEQGFKKWWQEHKHYQGMDGRAWSRSAFLAALAVGQKNGLGEILQYILDQGTIEHKRFDIYALADDDIDAIRQRIEELP